MSKVECESHTVFEGPIETGQVVHMPDPAQVTDTVLQDNFTIESDTLSQENLLSIVLPKMIIGPMGNATERSFLLLSYQSSHNPSVYKQILNAAKNGIKKFVIRFTDPESNDTISTWTFTKVRIHALDFGYIAKQRNENNLISVELSYEQIIIDNIAF